MTNRAEFQTNIKENKGVWSEHADVIDFRRFSRYYQGEIIIKQRSGRRSRHGEAEIRKRDGWWTFQTENNIMLRADGDSEKYVIDFCCFPLTSSDSSEQKNIRSLINILMFPSRKKITPVYVYFSMKPICIYLQHPRMSGVTLKIHLSKLFANIYMSSNKRTKKGNKFTLPLF